VALDGWERLEAADAPAVAARLVAEGAARLIVTDTTRDGMLGGPDLGGLAALRSALPEAHLVAAGGVASIDDLRALGALGIDGAVVGLALLSGDIDPAEALAVLS
jgi:phosphoribosylformimino-5-aminoimidazole carboxamide ribonucleotide (ProFAR) isomerase